MKILLTGPVGSGKSTQAKLLTEYLGLPLVAAGKILRDLSEKDTETAKLIRDDFQKGDLVDNQLVAGVIKKRVEEEDCKKGFVVDGFPRSLSQLELFDPGYDKVFFLNIEDEPAFKRMVLRGRADDKEEIIKNRLEVYHEFTEPVVKHYRQQGILREINAGGTIEEVQTEIRKALHDSD